MTKNLTASTAILALAVASCVSVYAPPPTTVSVGKDVEVVEGGLALVPIIKTGSGSAKFTFETVPGSATPDDFASQSGTITTNGSMTLAIQTWEDALVENPEFFRVILRPKSDKTTIVDGESVITILSDDVAPPEPVTCWDGSTVIPPAQCPVEPPPPIQCEDGSTVIPPATCPVGPPIPPSGNIDVPSIDGFAPINSVDPMLATNPTGIPGTAAPDVVGAFRLTCGFAGVGRFDPKVYPGDTTGKSHGHQFYGNTHITPFSSYETLRGEGPATCSYGEYPANRSAYWQPWLEDGRGNILQPDHVTLYYKRRPASDPKCQKQADPWAGMQCVDMPHGLFFIFGYDFLTNTPATGKFDFTCAKSGGAVVVFKTLADAAADTVNCAPGSTFTSRGTGPSCWNGTQGDSTNHRDHVSTATVRNGVTGQYRCPDSHPFIMPTVSVLSSWRIVAGDDLRLWRFSSDHMRPDLPAGSTFHVDFFMAWEPGIHAWWHDNCIDKLLNCSSGNTGGGRIITNAAAPWYPDPVTGKPIRSWSNPYRVIPIPGPESFTKLVGMNYGRAGRDWAGGRMQGRDLPPPQSLLDAAARFERIGGDDGRPEPTQLPVVRTGERGR